MRSRTAPGKGRLRAAFSWLESPEGARVLIGLGGLAGLLGVVGGAFGAHALRQSLTAAQLATIGTAVDYQMYHAIALLALGALQRSAAPSPWFARAGVCFVAGLLLFCGSLWAIGLTGSRAPGALAPLGGLLLMAGWCMTAIGALRRGS